MALNENAPVPALTEFMGKVSYGIYLWHFVAVFVAFYLLGLLKTLSPDSVSYTICLYMFSYGLTFAMATASYYFYERYFLLLKNKFKYT
jgi:peptidoglycan/LPS O-acetylase OafA/YrhL